MVINRFMFELEDEIKSRPTRTGVRNRECPTKLGISGQDASSKWMCCDNK